MKTLKLCVTILFLGLIIPVTGFGKCTYTMIVTHPTCGLNNGSIFIVVPDGCEPLNGFSVSVNGGLPFMTMQNPITNIAPGSYTIEAHNNLFVSLIGTATLTNVGNPITITNIPGSSNDCTTDCDASMGITATSASPITGYQWDHGPTTPNINNLCIGAYTVTVTNTDGCTAEESYNVGASSYLVTSMTTVDNSCVGGCNGTATVNAISNLPVTYAWSGTNATTSSLSNLCDGNYSVTTTGMLGCQTVENYSINTNLALNTNWQKSTHNQTQKNDVIKRTLLDDDGNLYVMGEFELESDLQGHPLSTNAPNQKTGIFLARYSTCGDLDWVSQLQNHGPIPFDLEAFDLDFDNNQSRIVVFGKWDNFDPAQQFTWIDGLGVDHTPANTSIDEDVFATEFNTTTGEFTQNENIQLDFQDRLTTGKSENSFNNFYIAGQIQHHAKIVGHAISTSGAPPSILEDNNPENIVADFIIDNTDFVAAINLEQNAANIWGSTYGNPTFSLIVRQPLSATAPTFVVSSNGEASINDIDIDAPGSSYPLIAVGTFRGAIPGWSPLNTPISSSITTGLIAQFRLDSLFLEGTYMIDGSIQGASAEAVNATHDIFVVTGWADGSFAKVTGHNGMGTHNLSGYGTKSMWTTKFNATNGHDQWFEGAMSQSDVMPYDIAFNFTTKEFYTCGTFLNDISLPSNNGLHNFTPGQGNTDGFLVRGHSNQFSASYYKTTGTENLETIRITNGELEATSIEVYPNPSNGNVTVDVSGLNDETVSLKVYSMKGQLLWSETILPNNGSLHTPLQLNQLSKGLYTLQLLQSEQMHTVKLMIE